MTTEGGGSGKLERLRCCFCGTDTEGAEDYVLLTLESDAAPTRQYLGAHAACMNRVLAKGFSVEVHLM
ncbi:hypothetical protein ACFV1F_30435 [Streptomyces sp. NPDC059590]|uniref:hypothetical protein n=1 Tax=unclassified Streptomyces TaxID=2593676 RepID=UPI0036994964